MAKMIRPISTGANKVTRKTTIAAITIKAITPIITAPMVRL
ncbi:MAG: hypothetical protein WAK17_21115 [Candidatus Nitrosopolaris sp.]|jgi:hypothetical protein